MKRFDVLTIGLQVIDLMIPGMDGHILDREMTLLDHAELTLGGDALNQAIVLSQLGARTALMGAAGVDRLGDVLLQQLSRYPLSVFDRRIDVPTAICVVLIDEAHERHFLFQPGQNLALRYEDLDEAVIRDSAFVSADGIEAHIPAFPCRCVDTTGAGDTFVGSFLYAKSQGWDTLASAKFACAAGSVAVEHVGTNTAIRSKDQVLAQMNGQ